MPTRKLFSPLLLLSLRSPSRRDARTAGRPQVSPPPPPQLPSAPHCAPGVTLFPGEEKLRVQLVRQRSKLSTKRAGGRAGGEGGRRRETRAAGREREREERSSFPLSDAGRFEGRTWRGCSGTHPPQLSAALVARMSGINRQETSAAGESLTLSFPPLLYSLSLSLSFLLC